MNEHSELSQDEFANLFGQLANLETEELIEALVKMKEHTGKLIEKVNLDLSDWLTLFANGGAKADRPEREQGSEPSSLGDMKQLPKLPERTRVNAASVARKKRPSKRRRFAAKKATTPVSKNKRVAAKAKKYSSVAKAAKKSSDKQKKKKGTKKQQPRRKGDGPGKM